MKKVQKTISTVLLSSLALQLSACGNLDVALPQIKQLGQNISSIATALEAQESAPTELTASDEALSEALPNDIELPAELESDMIDFASQAVRPDAELLTEPVTEPVTEPALTERPEPVSVRPRPLPPVVPPTSPPAAEALKVVHRDTSPLGSEKVYALSFRVGELDMAERRSVKLAQFNHPRFQDRPMIAVHYVEAREHSGLVVLHRETPRAKAKVVGKTRVQKGSINHLAFHLKWSNRDSGFLRVFYKNPEMKAPKGITGVVTGKTAYAQAPRLFQLENIPQIQSRLRKVVSGRDLLKWALRKLAHEQHEETQVDENLPTDESVEEQA